MRALSSISAAADSVVTVPAALLRGGSVNFHFSRKCNFACKYCFHTAKSSFMLPEDSQASAA
jgi:sulfatase maturation enzyme AslB (radical SAM superfamily)